MSTVKRLRTPLVQSPEFIPLMKLTGEEHAFSDSVDKVISGATQFGERIQPLLREFNRLSKEGKLTEGKHTPESFEAIHDFLKGRDFSDIQFENEDIVFLLSTPIGDVMRRPFIHTVYADKAAKEVDPGSEIGKRVVDKALKIVKASGWSKFIDTKECCDHILKHHKDENIFMDVGEAVLDLGDSMKDKVSSRLKGNIFEKDVGELLNVDFVESSEALGRLQRHAKKFLDDNAAKMPDNYLSQEKFYSDPGHAFAQAMDINAMCYEAEFRLHKRQSKSKLRLKRKATLMVVEDNEIHQMFFNKKDDTENLSDYTPDEKGNVGDRLDSKIRHDGFYVSAESALKTIDDNVKKGGKPPDFVITDIELAGTMNGLEMIDRIHEKYPDTTVFMVYSSNIKKYSDDESGKLHETLAKNHVIGGWSKQEFTFEKALAAMNEYIAKDRKDSVAGRLVNMWDDVRDFFSGRNKGG